VVPWQLEPSALWGPRSGLAATGLPGGGVLLMGGANTTQQLNDVWEGQATASGTNWTLKIAAAAWTKRENFGVVALPSGDVLVLGGTDGRFVFFNDVWLSRAGPNLGKVWEQQLRAAPWGGRAGFAAVVLTDSSVLVMGGCCEYYNDVWRSAPGQLGASWLRQVEQAGWSKRVGLAAVAMPGGAVLVLGGLGTVAGRTTYFNDVWRGTSGGTTWRGLTLAAPWAGRSDFAAVSLADGGVLIGLGRTGTSAAADVWYSAAGTQVGVDWTQRLGVPAWRARFSFGVASLAGTGGGVLILGGYACEAGVCETRLGDAYRRQPQCNLSSGPANGTLGSCPRFLDSGGECAPDCNKGYFSSGERSRCVEGALSSPTCSPLPCLAIGAPEFGSIGDCPTSMASGGSCQAQCILGFSISGRSICRLGDFVHSPCLPNPCLTTEAPEHGSVGNCPQILPSYATCQPACDEGYSASGVTSCFRGVTSPAHCIPDPCNVTETLSDFASLGDCPELLPSGATCQPICDEGFAASGPTECFPGELQPTVCHAGPCYFNGTEMSPEHGEAGDCGEELQSDAQCQPICNDGYDVSGPTKCVDTKLQLAVCSPRPCANVSQAFEDVNGTTNVDACPETMEHGATCRPTCSEGYAAPGVLECVFGDVQRVGDLSCQPLPCTGLSAPVNGSNGTCNESLVSGASCAVTCDVGFSPSNGVSCFTGKLTAASCVGDPCDMGRIAALPENGKQAGCPTSLLSGATCQPTCNEGYELGRQAFCLAGVLKPATCTPKLCLFSTPPANGQVGNCPATLPSGSWCQVACDAGFEPSGPSFCTLGKLTMAACEEQLSNVTLSFTIANVDYNALSTYPNFTTAFIKALQTTTLSQVDRALAPKQVLINLSPGSIRVEAVLVPGSLVGAAALWFVFDSAATLNSLGQKLAAALMAVSGIELALTGQLGISTIVAGRQSPQFANTTAPGGQASSGTGAAGGSDSGGISPAFAVTSIGLGVFFGMLCMCMCRRCRGGSKLKRKKGNAEGYPEAVGLFMDPIGCLWGGEPPSVPTRPPSSMV